MSPAEGHTLLLALVLGLRHGLDPDHIAVIDNLAFRMADRRPAWTGWVGTLFALGHSASVAGVALAASVMAIRLSVPAALVEGLDWAVILLLAVVGALNLRTLRRGGAYAPVGWRPGFARRFANPSRPVGVFVVGLVFGLVFDTASQAAAWGLAASASGGVPEAGRLALVFASGMIVTDTVDSQLMARLLRRNSGRGAVQGYRRTVGWVIVAMSFGVAAYATASKLADLRELPGAVTTALGAAMVVLVTAILMRGGRPPRAASSG